MVCNRCKNRVSDNALKCPRCGNKLQEDYFNAAHRSNISVNKPAVNNVQSQNMNNKSKTLIIVFSVIAGVFALVFFGVLIVLLTSSVMSDHNDIDYDAKFEVNNDFAMSISDDSDSKYYIRIYNQDKDDGEAFELKADKIKNKSFRDGIYNLIVMKDSDDFLRFEMTVISDCDNDSIEINYDKKKVYVSYSEDKEDDEQTSGQEKDDETTAPAETNLNNPDNGNMTNSAQNNSSVSNNSENGFYALVRCHNDHEYGSNETISYSREPDGYKLVYTITDYEPSTYSVYFDNQKRISRIINEYYDVVTMTNFTYDHNSKLTSKSQSDNQGYGRTIFYEYDEYGNLTTEKHYLDNGTSYNYYYEYSGPQLQHKYDINGGNEEWYYKYGDGNLIEIKHVSNGGAYCDREIFTHDVFHSMTSYIQYETVDSGKEVVCNKHEYTYKNNRLVSVSGQEYDVDSTVPFERKYSYDNNGNISRCVYNTQVTMASHTKTYEYSYISDEYYGLLDQFIEHTFGCTTDFYFYSIGSANYFVY
ncbi:MAG: hypothetical protein IJ289_08160 [Clostridia bacterium]|nr:hypothetical protein [Clostridia bacterium]